MRKVLVFQHVAHEILGTLNPLLKVRGLRVRYVNFDRNPDEKPSIEKYDVLIVLGGQMGASVRKSPTKEVGWHDIDLTEEGTQDPLLSYFKKREKIFQMHGDTFDIPASAIHLASSTVCAGQAFRQGDNVYGLQFHLEVDDGMIQRWMTNPMSASEDVNRIRTETDTYLENSIQLSQKTFDRFIDLFAFGERKILLGSDHSKPKKS